MNLAGLIGPSYVSQSPVFDTERCVNWYVERIEATGKAPVVYYPCPGFSLFSNVSGDVGPVRAIYENNGRCFAAIATSAVELFSGGAFTDHGAIAIDSNMASICSNGVGGNQVAFCSGGDVKIFDLTTNTLSASVVSNINKILFIDGYFIGLDINNSSVRSSALNDGTSWDPLDIAQRNDAADQWVGMGQRLRELWLFGRKTSLVYYNAGADGFPFVPFENAFVEEGCAATDSVAEINNQLYWLGSSGMVRRSLGYQAERISTHAVERDISQYTVTSDAIGITYYDQGHAFYILKFPTEGRTWCFDATTGLWHERGEWSNPELAFGAFRGNCCARAFNKNLVGDGAGGKIYDMSIDVATVDEDGEGMRRLRRTPIQCDENRLLSFSLLELDFQTGLGLTTGQGANPRVMLRASNDGGMTWGNQRTCSAGPKGQYGARVYWRQLGSARRRVYEIVVSDPIPWRLAGAFQEVA